MNTNNFLRYKMLLLLISFSFYVSSQDKTLIGKVTTFDSIPLVGVNIKVKSTQKSVQTDTLGRFQLFCNPKDKLIIKADGFYKKRVNVKKDIRLMFVNLNLKKGTDNLDKAGQFVNVGYGYVSSKDLLYAVSSADRKDIDFSKYDNVLDAIQGQLPGVTVENGNVVIRGTKTLMGSQGNEALIVIDGIITNSNDLLNMSPHDIKSINILKDGSSSVYGSRGANGVVIIETKKGSR